MFASTTQSASHSTMQIPPPNAQSINAEGPHTLGLLSRKKYSQQQCRTPQPITYLPCPPHVPPQTLPKTHPPVAVTRPLPSQITHQTLSPKLPKDPPRQKRMKRQFELLNSRSAPSYGKIGHGPPHHLFQTLYTLKVPWPNGESVTLTPHLPPRR